MRSNGRLILNRADRRAALSLRRTNLFAFTLWAFKVLTTKPYKEAPHVTAMCYAIEELIAGRRQIQLIALPPRNLKSIVATAAQAWALGRDPTLKIMVASYAESLTDQHAAMFRKLISHPEFKEMFPDCTITTNRANLVQTSAGGHRLMTTPESAATGMGADWIIIDDLTTVANARSEAVREAANRFIDETLLARFNDKANLKLLAIQQRTHERDVIGHLLDKAPCDALILPAIAQDRQSIPLYNGKFFERYPGDVLAPEHESRETLKRLAALMGAQAFEGQYNQNPTPLGGNRIQWDWFGSYTGVVPRKQLLHVVQSWDTAFSERPDADYSVCVTLGFYNDAWLILDVVRRRLNYTALLDEAKAQYRRWRPDRVLIENASTGGPLADQLRQWLPSGEKGRVVPWTPRLGKEERVEVYNQRLQEDPMFARPEDAAWLPAFRQELTGFPNAAHDDQVDALFQFLEWLGSNKGRGYMNIDPATGRQRRSTRPRGVDYTARLAGLTPPDRR